MLHGVNGCSLKLKGTVSRLCAPRATFVFSSKDNRIVLLTRQDFLSYHTADGVLLFIFSSNILDFCDRRSLSSYINIWFAVRGLIAILSLAGPPRVRKSCFARFKNIFSNLKLVSEVNCAKSSNICLICSRSSLKRLKDIDKNAISTL